MGSVFWASSSAGYEGFNLDEGIYPRNRHSLCRIKGIYLPGKCTVKALPTQDYKAEKAPGTDGATIILQGYLPGPIDIELEMWLEEQYTAWNRVVQEIWRKPGKSSAGFSDRGTNLKAAAKKREERRLIQEGQQLATEQAVSIETPVLQGLNIHRVVITGISVPEPGSNPDTRVVHIKCLEYTPPPATKQASRKVNASVNKPKPDAQIFDLPPQNSGGVSPGLNKKVGGPNGPPRNTAAGKAS